jgi:uncharacterized protein YbjT (DUF2867 family)
METHAFGFRLRANAPEGQKQFPISRFPISFRSCDRENPYRSLVFILHSPLRMAAIGGKHSTKNLFVGGIAQSATEGQTVRLPATLMQPIVSDDVADVMVDVALAEPLNSTIDLAGPEPIRQDELVRQFLSAIGDARTVVTDAQALYFGTAINDQSLTPGDNPRLGPTRFKDWLSRSAK